MDRARIILRRTVVAAAIALGAVYAILAVSLESPVRVLIGVGILGVAVVVYRTPALRFATPDEGPPSVASTRR